MLADLDQSKQLMDKFCDSELLESLDMLLTTSRLHKPHEVKSTTIDNCDQTCVVNHVSTYRIMQIVGGGKVRGYMIFLLFVGKLLRLYTNLEHLIIRKKKFAGKPSRLEANPRKPQKFSTTNELHYMVRKNHQFFKFAPS